MEIGDARLVMSVVEQMANKTATRTNPAIANTSMGTYRIWVNASIENTDVIMQKTDMRELIPRTSSTNICEW